MRLQALISIRIRIVTVCHSTLLINRSATAGYVLIQLNNVWKLSSASCTMRNQRNFSINACLLFRQEGWMHVLCDLFLIMRSTSKNMGLCLFQIIRFWYLLKSWVTTYGCEIYTVSLLEILWGCRFLQCILYKLRPFFAFRHIDILSLFLTQTRVRLLQLNRPRRNISCSLPTPKSDHVIVALLAAIRSHLKHMHHLVVVAVLIRTAANPCTF